VRHEAAEALGACAGDALAKCDQRDDDDDDDDETVRLLRLHAQDEDPIVAQSAMVALDIADYVSSDAFEYCETSETLARV
jgi:vesicle coat complex subunit